MNGDGHQDVVVSEWYTHKRLEWYENPGAQELASAGPWRRHAIGDLRAHDIKVSDLDGDGALEIVTRNQGASGDRIVIWKQDDPDSWAKRELPCPEGEGLDVVDLTGNGLPDIIIGGTWYESPGDVLGGTWSTHRFADWPVDAVVVAADMTRDGRYDVVLTRSEGPHHVSWFEAPADPRLPHWQEHLVAEDIDFAHSLRVCDVTGNGEPDIVIAEMHQSQRRRVMAFLNQGGSRNWETRILAETGSHNMRTADVFGIGRPAVVGANWSGPHQPVELWVSASSAPLG